MPPDEYASYREDEVAEDNVIQPLPPTVIQADKSKWSLYMHPKDEPDVYNVIVDKTCSIRYYFV